VDVILPIAGVAVNLAALGLVGLVVGFISGLFGIGGGFLMTPLLIFLGVPPSIAVATGSAQLVASASYGTSAAFTHRLVDRVLSTYLLLGAMIGTVLGIGVFNLLTQTGFFESLVGIAYVVLLGSVGGLMLKESLGALFGATKHHDATPHPNAIAQWLAHQSGPRNFTAFDVSINPLPLVGVSVLIGVIGTVLGVGGGFMFVPALIYWFRLPTRAAVAASQVQILVTMMVATVLHAVFNHAIDVVLAVPLSVGGVIGAHLGGLTAKFVHGAHFRLALAVIIVSVALRFLVTLVMAFTQQMAGAAIQKISLAGMPQWEGWIAIEAHDNALLYGLSTMLFALLCGFGAHRLINR